MNLRYMFKKTGGVRKEMQEAGKGPRVPEGLLKKCNACKAAVIAEDVRNHYYICPKCRNYFRVHARRRVEMIADAGSFREWYAGLSRRNPSEDRSYEEKLKAVREKTGLDEAILVGRAEIDGNPTALGICDSRFIMASMGEVVGEKIALMVERATRERLPVVIFACSGGARMQEGITSLMQMAKTAAALKRHSEAGGFYLSVLTHPTAGGVTASFAMLGDVILAEPGALIGFAGPRVIRQTIGQKLPKGFQKAEFLLEHGFIDRLVEREEQKTVIAQILALHQRQTEKDGEETDGQRAGSQVLREGREASRRRNPAGFAPESPRMTPWERVQVSRRKDRPVGSNYLAALFTDFLEFHGDRLFGDDRAVIGGIARFHGIPVTVLAQEKGKTTKENIEQNFGMPSPEGYRKALRLMKQAEKFGRPVFCFVDTPGAFCGPEAEERGQGEAIARNLYELSALKVPVLSVIVGEGGSGGALALAVGDEVWMLENAVYSILSPEGFASILWKDSKRAQEAANRMKLTAEELKQANIVEKVFAEPEHLTAETMDPVIGKLEKEMEAFLEKYCAMSQEERGERRYRRFRSF